VSFYLLGRLVQSSLESFNCYDFDEVYLSGSLRNLNYKLSRLYKFNRSPVLLNTTSASPASAHTQNAAPAASARTLNAAMLSLAAPAQENCLNR